MKSYYFPDDYLGKKQDTHVQFVISHRHQFPVTAAICLALNEENRVVLAKPKRGYDFPGGHVEKGETPLQALERELQEEVGAKLVKQPTQVGNLIFTSLKETKGKSPYPHHAQINVYLADVQLEANFIPSFESEERLIVPIDEIGKYHYHWSRQVEAVVLYIKNEFLRLI